MKRLLFLATALFTFNASAGDFYECGGFGGVDEYRAGISIEDGKAGFFDNDTTSLLKLTETKFLQSMPPQIQHVFEGKDAGYEGKFRLYFNQTRMHATIYSVDAQGNFDEIGSADCEVSEPWDLSEVEE